MTIQTYESVVLPSGARLQSGLPKGFKGPGARNARGLLLRGVVIATYVTDADEHPQAEDDKGIPLAIYCDVLIYPSIPYQRWFGLKNVLVTQDVAGVHRGKIWKPRAATIDLTKNYVDSGATINNPAYLDGDHVLIGFLNDSLDQPVILRALPHPMIDLGREDKEPLGRRMKLKKVDGDPDFWRHHGIFGGVDNDGNYILDSRFANNGELDDEGKEPDPPTDGKGTFEFRLPQDAKFNIVLYDMADPDGPVEVLHVTFQKDQGILDIKDPAGKFNVKVEDGECLTIEGKDGDAKLTLGDGAVKATIADHMEALWGTQKGWIEGHTHPSGTGPTGTPIQAPATAWDPNINSQKLTFTDN